MSDPLCTCKHRQSHHLDGKGYCEGRDGAACGSCCTTFVEAAPATDADWMEYERLRDDLISNAVLWGQTVATDLDECKRIEDALDAHVRRMSGRAE